MAFSIPIAFLFTWMGKDPLELIGLKKAHSELLLEPTIATDSQAQCETVREDTLTSEMESLTISELRSGNDLSLAYRLMDHIPLHLATSPDATSIKKIDLTECGVRYALCILYIAMYYSFMTNPQ